MPKAVRTEKLTRRLQAVALVSSDTQKAATEAEDVLSTLEDREARRSVRGGS